MKRTPLTVLSLGLCLLTVLSAPGQASPWNAPVTRGIPTLGASLPPLALPDVFGHRHSLVGMKQPVTLLFFCGCTPCHDFARLWSQVQQSGDLAPQAAASRSATANPATQSPATVVVFLGGADAARAFAAQTGLDLSQTLLLLDPLDQIGQRFGVIQCPRVFVADGAHRLVYTSPDDPAPHPSAPALVSRTLTAWRRLPADKNPAPGKNPAPEKKAAP